MEKREEKKNKKKIEAIIKSEREKWASLKKHQEEKRIRGNKGKYDKFIVQEPNQMRIVVIGEACSGKSCFIKRYIKNEFNSEYITTLTIEAFKSELLFYEDASFRIELIDTPPLENFYEYLDELLYFVQGIIFVFDASNKNSFLRMQNYFKIINFYNFQKIGVVATKKDLCEENYKYKYYQLEKFCERYKALCSFISSKNNTAKEDISKFIDSICPEIIPSLVNKKENLNLMYPYTKSTEVNIPKKNVIDEAIIRKAKDEDSSYESEESKNKERNKEEEIKEFLLKKKKNPEKKKQKMKPNYIYNIGNNINKKYQEDNVSFNFEDKKEELNNFNDVMGNINLDLEKLFQKYRPESGSIKNEKNRKRKYINKNKTIEEDRDWVNVNIDSLIEEFMNTRTGLNKNNKDKNKSENKSKKSSDKKSSIKKTNNNNQNEEKKEKNVSINISKKSKSKKDEENKKSNISGSNKNEKEKISEIKENNKDEGENEDNKKESENNINEEEKENEDKKSGEGEGGEKEEEKAEKYSDEFKNNNEEDDEYEDLYRDIYNFQQNAINEAAKENVEYED